MPSSTGVNGFGLLRPEMFRHYDKMDANFLKFLDLFLQGAGYTSDNIVITSDWRDPQEQESQIANHGGATHSLHELGCAVDLRMPRRNGKVDYKFLGMIVESAALYRRGIQTELELDITPDDMHVHIGQWVAIKGPLLLIPTCRLAQAA